MKIDIMTLFPEMCNIVVNESIIGRAIKAEKVQISCTNIRDYAGNKHNKVDDSPYGGGMGMIMSAQPIYDCFNSLYDNNLQEKPHLIYMSPKGITYDDFYVWCDAATEARDKYLRGELTAEEALKIIKVND